MITFFKDKKRIVIKVGSSLLVEEEQIKSAWLESLAQDVFQLKKLSKEIIIVSSGAIALGRHKLSTKNIQLKLSEKHAAAAIGQIELISCYQSCFAKLGLNIAQILITGDDANNRKRYLNSRSTINKLLANNIIPIVNENDVVAAEEIRIGDNDRLAARIAQITEADLLILFSDIDGLYDQNPKTNQDAKFIPLVTKIDKKIEAMASNSISGVGTGGMITKIKAAKMAFNLGCDCIISNGLKLNPIRQMVDGKKFTLFRAINEKINSKKQWIVDCLNIKSEVIIDYAATQALFNNSSLLPVGTKKVIGEFNRGDVILVKDEQNKHIATGIACYDSTTAKSLIGKIGQEELIHRDDLVLKSRKPK
jgi:glutamate 5-kinase